MAFQYRAPPSLTVLNCLYYSVPLWALFCRFPTWGRTIHAPSSSRRVWLLSVLPRATKNLQESRIKFWPLLRRKWQGVLNVSIQYFCFSADHIYSASQCRPYPLRGLYHAQHHAKAHGTQLQSQYLSITMNFGNKQFLKSIQIEWHLCSWAGKGQLRTLSAMLSNGQGNFDIRRGLGISTTLYRDDIRVRHPG